VQQGTELSQGIPSASGQKKKVPRIKSCKENKESPQLFKGGGGEETKTRHKITSKTPEKVRAVSDKGMGA